MGKSFRSSRRHPYESEDILGQAKDDKREEIKI